MGYAYPSMTIFTSQRALVAGVDEAGRGPLAGPVVVAAVILNTRRPILGIADSKILSPQARHDLAIEIRSHCLAWSVAWADAAEIDTINILQATFLAMRRAISGLPISPHHVQVDGNRAPSIQGLGLNASLETIIRGDATHAAIGAASILAKTTRDSMMGSLDKIYPGYGLGGHKGYGTREHFYALKEKGPCRIHRMTFAPVRLAARGEWGDEKEE